MAHDGKTEMIVRTTTEFTIETNYRHSDGNSVVSHTINNVYPSWDAADAHCIHVESVIARLDQ